MKKRARGKIVSCSGEALELVLLADWMSSLLVFSAAEICKHNALCYRLKTLNSCAAKDQYITNARRVVFNIFLTKSETKKKLSSN